ncbi:MAG TPA: hypothetical protein PK336_08015, partial [Methanoculleus sp.]|nr:hypothetical protein [Methanoculleus sp.]
SGGDIEVNSYRKKHCGFFIGFGGTDGDCARACEEHRQKAPAREGEQSQPGFTVTLDLHSRRLY